MAYGPEHILTIICSFFFHLAVFKWLASPVLRKISPVFKTLPPKKQVVITNSVMALVHGAIVGGIAGYILLYPGNVLPSVFWYDSPTVRHVACIFCGYTVADILVMATHPYQMDPLFVVHHLIGIFGSLAGTVDPILPYFSNLVCVQELSSPFVNLRIILHALGKKTTTLYTLNGVLMLVTFFTCRIATIPLWFQISQHMATEKLYTARPSLLITIFVCIPISTVFNIYWFVKMCKGAYRLLYPKV